MEFLVLILLTILYFLPWIVADIRNAKGIGGIIVLNLFRLQPRRR
jgi:hypothetical protein